MTLAPWPRRPLGELVDVLDHKRVPISTKERAACTGSVPYYGATGQVGWIDKPLFDEPLLLLGEDGVQFFDHGKPKAFLIDGPSWVNNHAHVLRPRRDVVERRFLMHYLNVADFHGFANGTTRLKLTKSAMVSMPVPLPPLDEQRRIVEILEDHLSRIDAARRYLETVERKAHAMAGAVLQTAISKLPGHSPTGTHRRDSILAQRVAFCPPSMKRGRPIPTPPLEVPVPWDNVWATFSLEELTHPVRTVSYGILKPGPNVEGGVPYVRVVDMRGDRLDIDGLHKTTKSIANSYTRASLTPGDVLVSIRGTYGRVVVVPDSLDGANITQDTARLAFLPFVSPKFAAIVLRSPFMQHEMKRVARGVAVKGVNITDLRSLPFPLPSMEDQLSIVARVDELTSDLKAATESAKAGLRRGRALRAALLAAAFSGRLDGTASPSRGKELARV